MLTNDQAQRLIAGGNVVDETVRKQQVGRDQSASTRGEHSNV